MPTQQIEKCSVSRNQSKEQYFHIFTYNTYRNPPHPKSSGDTEKHRDKCTVTNLEFRKIWSVTEKKKNNTN